MNQIELAASVIVILVVLVAFSYLAVVTARKQQLLGRPGGISLAMRVGSQPWTLGVGRYAGDELWWYGALRLARRPTRVIRRSDLDIIGQRGRRPDEQVLSSNAVIVECHDHGAPISLCFAQGAVTGFLSWLEASAPH
ncbi:MAG: DUF2550 domain-containing protein [Jatrophihabitans sp.]